MKNKKSLSLVLAISFAMPVQAHEGWRHYFPWIFLSSFLDKFKDNTRYFVFGDKPLRQWTSEAISGGTMHAAMQFVMGSIFLGGAYAWQQTGGKLWYYWELKKSFKQTKPVDEEESKIQLDWDQLLLTDKLVELKEEILKPKQFGNWSRGAFIYGLPGNGKTEFVNLLALTAQATEDGEDGASYVRLFSGNLFKALLGRNGNIAGEAFKAGVSELSRNRKHKKKPKIVILDEGNQLLGDKEDSNDNSVRGSMYDGALEYIPKVRGDTSFIIVGNYDIAPPIKSRISRTIVVPNPSIAQGLAKYKGFFLFLKAKDFDNSQITEDFITKNFKKRLAYQDLFPWLFEMTSLETRWSEAKLLKQAFGEDRSILSVFAWTQIAESVHSKACRSEVKIISQKMFAEAMEDQLDQATGMLHTLMEKKVPKNIEPIIHTYYSTKSKKQPKLTLSTEWPSGQFSAPSKIPQLPVSLPVNINNNALIAPSLVTTVGGLPSSVGTETDK